MAFIQSDLFPRAEFRLGLVETAEQTASGQSRFFSPAPGNTRAALLTYVGDVDGADAA